jgi:CheY-like chemotaxis protein
MSKAKTCLIVDDDPDDLEIFLICVKKVDERIECHTATMGVEAISTLTANQEFIPDYIFLDVNMPRNGWDRVLEGA